MVTSKKKRSCLQQPGKAGHTYATSIWGKLFSVYIYDREKHTSKKTGLKHSRRLESSSDRNFCALTQPSERLHLQQSQIWALAFPAAFYSAAFHARLFHYHYLKSKKAYNIFASPISYSLDVPTLGNNRLA